jgi:hypothetical protein
LQDSLQEIGGEGFDKKRVAEITNAWVSGESIQEIARDYFRGDEDETKAITNACRAIYRHLVNTGTWGVSALSRLSGIDFDSLSEPERRRINALPAMVYHGVKSEDAVLMRMNAAPRSIAENLGEAFRHRVDRSAEPAGVHEAREFLKRLDAGDWERMRPGGSHLTGLDYKKVWELLSGEWR